jgi:hypothetical protein
LEEIVMAVIGLNLPTDIRWERICVTEDMMAKDPCALYTPPKWHTSIAVYRYLPEQEYQIYPGRRILYFKVVCTITSYQPQADEIETQIDWTRMHFQDKVDFEDKLKSYLPCNGAIIQVIVTPPPKVGDVAIGDYPYFMEVQPKQRVLYETATDTNERASRSLETVNVTKSAGNAESLEVLDVWAGSNINVQGGGQSGAGVAAGRTGQEGTQRLGQSNVTDVRTTDSSREARETVSHTTQITQMYNLFQAYHVGTNRALFYIAPRPHTLENPSGFIKPREIDGIQELFLIVNQPQDQGDPCLAARVDTAHLTETPQSDYDQHPGPPLSINFEVAAPTKESLDKGPRIDAESGDWYDCYDRTVKFPPQVYTADEGYYIVGGSVKGDDRSVSAAYSEIPASCTVDIDGHTTAQDGHTITMVGQASGHACFRNGQGDLANMAALSWEHGEGLLSPITSAIGEDAESTPKTKHVSSGLMQRTITFDVKSKLPIKPGDPKRVLAVTSRGLCCCALPLTSTVSAGKIVHVEQFDSSPASPATLPDAAPPLRQGLDVQVDLRSSPAVCTTTELQPMTLSAAPAKTARPMTSREANALSERITQAIKRISSLIPDPQNVPALDGDFMFAHFSAVSNANSIRKDRMIQRVAQTGILSSDQAIKVAAILGKPVEAVNYYDVATLPPKVLSAVTGKNGADLRTLRLNLLGFVTLPVVSPPPA